MFNSIAAKVRRWRMDTLKPFGKLRPECLRISLGDRNPEVAAALAGAFGNVPEVEVVAGNLLELSCDAIVSPANSFGDMGGGIDKAIDDFHRGEAQRAVVNAIASQFFGELPVGAALVVRFRPAVPVCCGGADDAGAGSVGSSDNQRVPGDAGGAGGRAAAQRGPGAGDSQPGGAGALHRGGRDAV